MVYLYLNKNERIQYTFFDTTTLTSDEYLEGATTVNGASIWLCIHQLKSMLQICFVIYCSLIQ